VVSVAEHHWDALLDWLRAGALDGRAHAEDLVVLHVGSDPVEVAGIVSAARVRARCAGMP
jgi:hypothetical protein